MAWSKWEVNIKGDLIFPVLEKNMNTSICTRSKKFKAFTDILYEQLEYFFFPEYFADT